MTNKETLNTYSLLFVNKNLSLGFIKLLCTHDFSRVSFAAELSTTLALFFKLIYMREREREIEIEIERERERERD